MSTLRTYSPVAVLLAWATWVGALGRSDFTVAVWLTVFAGSIALHVWEERRGR